MTPIDVSLMGTDSHKTVCYFMDSGSKRVVIFCHGYRSSAIGPNRLFVRISQELSEKNISALRFDQYGSGNSPGDFYESSFDNWISAIRGLADHYHELGYEVVLLGQSMGASAAIVAASTLGYLKGLVAWVPDPSVENFVPPESDYIEEAGQRVRVGFWREAHDAGIAESLRQVACPALVIQCSEDEYVSGENHEALIRYAQPHHILYMLEGYQHSSWSYEQASYVLKLTVDFICNSVGVEVGDSENVKKSN